VKLSNFFKSSKGKFVVVQWPNWPIWIIFGVSALDRKIDDISKYTDPIISFMLFYWGFLEVTQGLSGFRKMLGLIAIGYSVYRLVE